MNNKGIATVTIIIIIACAIVVLGGAIGGVVAYNSYQDKKQQEAREAERIIEEQNKNKKILGVIYDNQVLDFSENDVRELCSVLGINYSEFDSYSSVKVEKSSIDSSTRNFISNNSNCRVLIFASNDYKDYAEKLKNEVSNINIYVAETQRLINLKKDASISTMVVSKSQAQSASGFYILRGDKYIDIGKQIKDSYVFSLFRDYGFTDWRSNAVMILKDYTFPYYTDGDKLVAFSGKGVPEFYLDRVRELNYTIPVTWNDGGGFFDIKDYVAKGKPLYGVKSKYPSDVLLNGEKFQDKLKNINFVPLTQGEEVKFTWYEGTQYHEDTIKADYKYYTFYDRRSYDNYDENHMKITGTLGTDGYAEYDLSNVPNGLYWLKPISSQDGKNTIYQGFIEISR